jgi:hypothetical protein
MSPKGGPKGRRARSGEGRPDFFKVLLTQGTRGVLKNGFTRLAGGLSVERSGRLRLSSVADAQSAPSSPKRSTKSLPTQTNESVLQHPPRGLFADHEGWRLCPSESCDVVYYHDDEVLRDSRDKGTLGRAAGASGRPDWLVIISVVGPFLELPPGFTPKLGSQENECPSGRHDTEYASAFRPARVRFRRTR